MPCVRPLLWLYLSSHWEHITLSVKGRKASEELLSGLLPGHQTPSGGGKVPPFLQESRAGALRPPVALWLHEGGPAKGTLCEAQWKILLKKKKRNILETVSALAKP